MNISDHRMRTIDRLIEEKVVLEKENLRLEKENSELKTAINTHKHLKKTILGRERCSEDFCLWKKI